MIDTAALPPETDETLPPPGSAEDLAQRQLRALERMAARCERVAEALEQRLLRLADSVDGTPDEQAATNAAINAGSLAFDRANRAIRLTFILQSKVRDGSLAAQLKRREDRAAQAAARQAQIDERRGDVIAAVDEAIDAENDIEGPSPPREHREAQDLLDRAEDWLHGLSDEAVLAQPIGGMVEQILTHLGLAFDADSFEDEPWASEEQRTRPPGSPYAAPRTVWRRKARALQDAEEALIAAAGPMARPP